MTEKMFREVQPCGMLYTFGREYFLLKPQPVERDSWQGDNAYRWAVVPNKFNHEDDSYPFARHIVSNAFTVDYSPDMPVIRIWQLGEIDLSKMEWSENIEMDLDPIDEAPDYLDKLDILTQELLGADINV